MTHKHARNYLIELYFDYVNNYLTIELFAEHNGLRVDEAISLIKLAREIACTKHPEE